MQPGTHLGPYSITGALGAGAMGEVYRARDRKLDRDVAIKVLPAAFVADPERLARFEREARALAALNHPHIAQIYGFEHQGDVRALVLELVEGETLADRLQRPTSGSGGKPGMRIAEALAIARQIADALDAAHEKGIVHRDLKPANIKITPTGDVKVLDFGLAKTLSVAAAGETNAPTLTLEATEHGVLIGSVPYMSPEQARGQSVDEQTDIWALGCVLYEMLTGRRPFRGTTTSDVLAAILEREPDWSALPKATPPAIERLLRRCLEKDPKRRLHDSADARLEIDEALAAPATGIAAAPVRSRSTTVVWGAGAVVLIVLGALAGWALARRSTPDVFAGPVRVSIPFLDTPKSAPHGTRHLAISEDGSMVAYAAEERLWLRRMDQPDAVAVGGTDNNPFFSPDGRFVVGGDLFKIPIDGGPLTRIPGASGASGRDLGAAWGANDTIVFATTEGLYQVEPAGGDARVLARPDRGRGEQLYAWPHFLPGGQSILFTIVPEQKDAAAKIATMNLETLERKVVLEGGTDARYVGTGHLVYASGPTLNVVPFDAATGEVRGDTQSVPGVEVATAGDTGAANFAVAANGTLVFTPPRASTPPKTLQWIDREGNRERLPIKPSFYFNPRMSPDGTRVAIEDWTPSRDIWILDLVRLTVITQLTDGPTQDLYAVWSNDGSRVFFASDRAGNMDVYSQAADGASPARLELAAPNDQFPVTLTPDGTRLLVQKFDGIDVITLGPPARLETLLDGSGQGQPDLSSDGRWMVYQSSESGSQQEIFARPFPDVTAGRKRISVNGGHWPRFSPDDREVYYYGLDGDMMAASVTLTPTFEVKSVRKLFTWAKQQTTAYSVSPLNGRFFVAEQAAAESEDRVKLVSVVLNWSSELARLAPAKP